MSAARDLVLWYETPAAQWVHALPVGDGRCGAMVFGGVGTERLAINDERCWSGSPELTAIGQQPNVEAGPEVLAGVRLALAQGRLRDAERLLLGVQGGHTQSYMPIGDLELDVRLNGSRPQRSSVTDYRRRLDLRTAAATTSYLADGVQLTQEVFVTGGVVVVRLGVDVPGALDVEVRLGSALATTGWESGAAQIGMSVICPADVSPAHVNHPIPVWDGDPRRGGMPAAAVAAVDSDGDISSREGDHEDSAVLRVRDASDVVLVIATETGYDGVASVARSAQDCLDVASARARSALSTGIEELRSTHRQAHAELFDRVDLDLGASPEAELLPTDQRLRRRTQGHRDPGLEALLFQYGRYLLISSSRPGTLPANLQGIWNDLTRPPWSSNFTLNINFEMNYWLAETTALPECHQPMLDFIERLAAVGAATARSWYGARGWVAHHNSDAWHWSAPVGDGEGAPCWANWPFGGVWLSRHLWDHYTFTQDVGFLRERAWPILLGAAQFCLDWLVELPDGSLGTSPSTSPENEFRAPDGGPSGVDTTVTMDRELIGGLFDLFVAAADVLGEDNLLVEDGVLVRQAAAARLRLPGPQIGSRGQILEFSREFEEMDPHHRHLSHLFGVFPDGSITPRRTPELAAAARESLTERGDAGTGWSLAWKVCLWARLGDGDHALGLIRRMLTVTDELETNYMEGVGAGVYLNLLCAHPPFQIDGNFGVAAGIAELLLQSHDGGLHLLPALPSDWTTGSVRGLRARGAITVDLTWSDGTLDVAHLMAGQDCVVEVRIADRELKVALTAGRPEEVR